MVEVFLAGKRLVTSRLGGRGKAVGLAMVEVEEAMLYKWFGRTYAFAYAFAEVVLPGSVQCPFSGDEFDRVDEHSVAVLRSFV